MDAEQGQGDWLTTPLICDLYLLSSVHHHSSPTLSRVQRQRVVKRVVKLLEVVHCKTETARSDFHVHVTVCGYGFSAMWCGVFCVAK